MQIDSEQLHSKYTTKGIQWKPSIIIMSERQYTEQLTKRRQMKAVKKDKGKQTN